MPGCDPCQTIRELLATMHTLRAPGGCPWDAEQTPESLAPYILEEACETVEAIETGSSPMIAAELGDLLLQIVFQAEIFAERGQFDFADVAAGINAKLLRRHPHVFASPAADISRENLSAQWERIKSEERERPAALHPLGPIPGNLPALQRAQKLVKRALQAGMDVSKILPRVPAADVIMTEQELGRALLTLVRQAEANSLDAEQALRREIQKILREAAPTEISALASQQPT